MFSQRTVMILGAGASNPYGFPVGSELVAQILNWFDPQYLIGIMDSEFKRFQRELRQSCCSIDAFLEHRNEFLQIGKLVIAVQIAKAEYRSDLFGNADWYGLLLDKIAPNRESLAKNKLTIFSFNYDRSLEHFLHSGLMSRFGIGTEEAAELLKPISIYHVYGRLGPLPWQGKHQNDFAPPMEYGEAGPLEIAAAGNGIRLIRERRDDAVSDSNENLSTIIERALIGAKTTYFLGFGFHPENMFWFRDYFRKSAIRATGYNLTLAEKNDITTRCGVSFLEHSNMLIKEFLRNEALFQND